MEQELLGYFYSSATFAPFIVAFIAGALSFLSPCTLPLVPFYMSYISGISLAEINAINDSLKDSKDFPKDSKKLIQNPPKDCASNPPNPPTKSHLQDFTNPTKSKIRAMIFARSFAFVLGFSLVFVLLGSALRSVFFVLDSRILEIIAGVIVLIFGLHFLGIFRFGLLYKTKKFDFKLNNPIIKILAPFVLGVSFAFGWSPCTGPIFGAIALMASTSTQGIILLCLYALGFALPFLVLALAIERGFELIDKLKPHLRKIEILSGILLILISLFIISGYLGKISEWVFGF